jgi:hypothetical protein
LKGAFKLGHGEDSRFSGESTAMVKSSIKPKHHHVAHALKALRLLQNVTVAKPLLEVKLSLALTY